ncbi:MULTISPECIES: hypothetical protein [Enterococcus]|nr:hypothetical protein [Enterococcus sp. MJM16]MBO0451378.1 hypothetical protein [Enterococcus sp. MJM16]
MQFEQIVKPDQWILSQSFTVKVEEIPQVIGPTFMKLGGFIQTQGIQILSTPFVSYKGMDETGGLDEQAIQMEVGFPIAEEVQNAAEVEAACYHQPSYKALSTLYVGKYDEMANTYFAMMAEIKNIGGKFIGTGYEYYLSDEEIPEEQQETILELVYE